MINFPKMISTEISHCFQFCFLLFLFTGHNRPTQPMYGTPYRHIRICSFSSRYYCISTGKKV